MGELLSAKHYLKHESKVFFKVFRFEKVIREIAKICWEYNEYMDRLCGIYIQHRMGYISYKYKDFLYQPCLTDHSWTRVKHIYGSTLPCDLEIRKGGLTFLDELNKKIYKYIYIYHILTYIYIYINFFLNYLEIVYGKFVILILRSNYTNNIMK